MGKIIRNNIEYTGSSNSAGNISYDNSTSELQSQTVQNAITELKDLVDESASNGVGRFEKDDQGNITGEIFNTYSGNNKNVASGSNSHAEGYCTTASGDYASHAEGYCTTASGDYSHAEGADTTASGDYSHAEGDDTIASGDYGSHAEGSNTEASGQHSHAEGCFSTAFGKCSHAGGNHTIATAEASTVIGKYNVADGTGISDPKHLFIIGNGTSDNARSNIVEVSETDMNVNGSIKQNGVSTPTVYTTMPTVTSTMVGQVAQYMGVSSNTYKKGCFYEAVATISDPPEYGWSYISGYMDSTPTSGSTNAVTSDGIATLIHKGTGNNAIALGDYSISLATASGNHAVVSGNGCSAKGRCSFAHGDFTIAQGDYSVAFGSKTNATQPNMFASGIYNSPRTGDLFNIGNGTASNARSNILEVNQTSMNINGDIQRDGVGIDDYTTTERKIGKWIDGSDLYQRTFEVTGLVNGQWNENVLGTSGINIVDAQGWIDWTYNSEPNGRTNLNYYSNPKDFVGLQIEYNDLIIKPNRTGDTGMLITEAVITIKYTKPVANLLSNNIQTANEPNEEPTEGEDMRSEPVEDDMR